MALAGLRYVAPASVKKKRDEGKSLILMEKLGQGLTAGCC